MNPARGELERRVYDLMNHTVATIKIFEWLSEMRRSFPLEAMQSGGVNQVEDWYWRWIDTRPDEQRPLCYMRPYSPQYAPVECDTCPWLDDCCREAATK